MDLILLLRLWRIRRTRRLGLIPRPAFGGRKIRMFALQTQFNTSYACVEAVYSYIFHKYLFDLFLLKKSSFNSPILIATIRNKAGRPPVQLMLRSRGAFPYWH